MYYYYWRLSQGFCEIDMHKEYSKTIITTIFQCCGSISVLGGQHTILLCLPLLPTNNVFFLLQTPKIIETTLLISIETKIKSIKYSVCSTLEILTTFHICPGGVRIAIAESTVENLSLTYSPY